jgi:SAM-dependent methyltransferase
MPSTVHPWENIFKNNLWPHMQPFQGFGEVVEVYKKNGVKTVLDLGCGNGRHTIHLEARGFKTFGVDISISGLQQTQHRYVSATLIPNLVLSDIRFPLPFRDNVFDGLLSTQVIHHAFIAQIQLTIHEIWRVMISDGVAFVTVAGKLDEGGEFEEVEPDTYVPLTGDERGLPHHIFDINEVYDKFSRFNIEDVSIRAGGHVIAIYLRKP